MIRHVVSIRFREEAGEAHAVRVQEALEALPAVIPEIRALQVGLDVVRGPNSSHLVLIVDFDDLDALDRYRTHPAHQDVVKNLILPEKETITAVDYEAATPLP